MYFPYYSIPDGNVLLPHHFTYVTVAALLVTAVVRDDVLHHSFGIWTPLDRLWRVDGYGLKHLTPSP